MPSNRKRPHINLNDKKERLFSQIPKSLKEAVVEKSKKARRSISSEVTLRLALSLRDHEFIAKVPDFEE